MHGARLLGGTEIDAQISRAARVNMAMGGSGAAAARALRIASDSAATGSTRGNDSDDIRRWYASMKIDNDGAANASPRARQRAAAVHPGPTGRCASRCSPWSAPRCCLEQLRGRGCCKAMRRMPALRKALAAVKVQHQTARALATRCSTTPSAGRLRLHGLHGTQGSSSRCQAACGSSSSCCGWARWTALQPAR